jgi:MFS family permease
MASTHLEQRPIHQVQSLDHDHDAADTKLDLHAAARQTGSRSVAMAQALALENPRPFRRSFLRLYACLFVAYMCSSTNGFDANTFGGLSAEPNFAAYFDLTPANNGAVVVLYVVGQLTACLFAGPLADMYGRRFGMALGSTICIIGAAVQASSRSRPDLMAGRFVLGLGSVICNASGPAYVVEMAYPKYRGFLTGLYQAMFFCGTISTSWLEFGLSYLPTDSVVAWRLPLAMQAVPSLILVCLVYFIPETPRWWMAQDRADKAREILVRYHGDGNEDSPIVALEMEEMQAVVSSSGSDKRFWDFRDLFNSPGARYRTLLVVAVAWFSEIELPPTSYYLPLMGMCPFHPCCDSETKLTMR